MLRNKSLWKRLWFETRWILLGFIWLTGLSLGYAGFAQYSQTHALNWSVGDVIYRTLQLVTMESGAFEYQANGLLFFARFLLPALTAFTALQALMHLFHEQTQWLRLWRIRDHVIVCGYGRKGELLTRELVSLGYTVVVIEKDPDRLLSADVQRQGVIFLTGDATDQDLLANARIHRASYLLCLLGEDRDNLQTAFQAYQLKTGQPRKSLTCVVHLETPHLVQLIQQSKLTKENTIPFQLEIFNPYTHAARQILSDDPGWQEVQDGEPPAHLLVIGLGRLGENLVLQVAYTWYLQQRTEKLRFTILDREAKEKAEKLFRSYPQLSSVCDIHPVSMELEPDQFLDDTLAALSDGTNKVQRIYVCLSNPILSLQICFSLLKSQSCQAVPIRVRLDTESGLTGLIEKMIDEESNRTQILTFDLFERTCSAEIIMSGAHERLAQALHAQYCAAVRFPPADKSSCLPWEDLSETLKNTNRQQANRIYKILQTASYRLNTLQDWNAGKHSFSPDEVETMAQTEHALWQQAQQEDGWIFGQLKDEKKHTHPDLVDWVELPETEKEKNREMVRQLPGLLAKIGYQIDRT